jgi:hypothetical protein
MRIRWINHPNPKSQHLNGKIVHEARESVAPFILSGQCEEVPYENHVEYLNDVEKQRQAALPKSAAPATGWTVRESTSNDPRVRFIVVETSPLGEITFYDAPPAHAPRAVKQKFADAIATDAAAFSSRAEFLKQQRNEPSRTNGYNEFDLARVTFGANGVKRG